MLTFSCLCLGSNPQIFNWSKYFWDWLALSCAFQTVRIPSLGRRQSLAHLSPTSQTPAKVTGQNAGLKFYAECSDDDRTSKRSWWFPATWHHGSQSWFLVILRRSRRLLKVKRRHGSTKGRWLHAMVASAMSARASAAWCGSASK